jgi:ribosomal protein S18 acetylase RimI-like enzyme
MQVRLLHESDLQVAKELMHQLGYDISISKLAARIDRVQATRTHYAAVADDGGKVLGLVHAYERPALEKPLEAIVQSLVVDVSARKLETGKLLMTAAEAWARARGLTHIALHTRIDRADARAFYERIGYRKAATAHLMGKWLETS